MKFTLLLVAVALITPSAIAEDVAVAAAADLQFALPQIAKKFEAETGNKIQLTFGSSGDFFAQIQNGAPYDLFFSADLTYPQRLVSAGLADKGSLVEYGTGEIVLWVKNGSEVNIEKGLSSLLDPRIKKIAVANPSHAPYGRAAVAALKQENLFEKLSDKIVYGENISQTATFVTSGAADVGIIAKSLALSDNMRKNGKSAPIPAADYPPIEQGAILVKKAMHPKAAQQFLDYMKTSEAADILTANGFRVSAKP